MFSIAAINDTDSKGQWEPLAPTKEAQEFHLSQTYHEGLLKLQAKDYEKACELLEAVLKDPLISNPQVNGSSTDSHLLQLRFLTLKNLAGAFLQRGCTHYDSALQCYLQAVEIDSNDSVVWNQLGTLSCSIDLLSISRWAFEQGLLCSPNNWNCMEKLLEVLIAIGDEVSCLSVAELILKHWPSHSRALHVKSTIEEPEPSPFAPRGIDKLEPKHVRLKFTDKKRKVIDENLHDKIATPSKRLNQNIDLHLTEVTWPALADELLKILLPLSRRDSELENEYKSGDIRLSIHLPSSSQDDRFNPVKEDISVVDSEKDTIGNQKEANNSEEQPQERRSTRLERLRSRKPGKEELDFSVNKDLGKVVLQYLQPFIAEDSDNAFRCSVDVQPHSLGNESDDIKKFVMDNSKNYGAFHISHLLLEDIASKYVLFQDNFVNFLELEKLTRQWGQNRTPECSLFLAELYYDFGVPCSDSVKLSEFMSEASYHLCKIIESVVSDYPFDLKTTLESSIITEKGSFWVRFFWLSGRLSILEGNKAKAQQEFSTALSILRNNKNPDSSLVSVLVPHCRVIKKLSFDRIYSEINILEIDLLMKKTVGELLGKEMYSECIDLLSPLIFSLKNELPSWDKGDEGFATSIEISAIDALIEACEKVKLLNIEVYMNCHRRKLQLLALSAGMEECIDSQQEFHKKLVSKALSVSEIDLKEKQSSHWTDLVAEEVKGISRCASKVRNMIDQSLNSSGLTVPLSTIGEIQYLLMAIMCNIATILACNKYSVLSITDEIEEKQKCCFVDAAVAFCKFQHLNQTIPIKSQVELIVAVHDLLAEYGLCCMGEDGEGVEGTFLRLAIKHLLALDMNLKSNFHFINYSNLNTEMSQNSICETITEKDARKGINSESNDNGDEITDGKFINGENGSSICVESVNKLTEEEREELELGLDNALNQCFFCLYGLNLRSDTSFEDDLAMHKNTSRGDYQTREQCADVFQYILPYAKASSKTGLSKLRRVLRAIRKHFPQPPEDVLSGNPVDKFLDDLSLCENKLSEEVESDGFLESIMKTYFPSSGRLKQNKTSSIGSSEPFLEVYSNLYYLLAQSEEISATDKWPGFVLTKEGEEFVEQNARLFKYDLLYNPLRFESWQRLANLYDEEVDLLLNDGSKHINVAGWRKNPTLPQRVETSRRRSRRCLLMSLALAKTPAQQSEIHELLALVYYDSLQNVVPFYDQRSVLPLKDETWKMFCQNSLRHFEKAFANRQDWSHAFYLGKLCEKLGYTHEISLSYYEKAIALNSSAVDPFYRMHASRLKLLYTFGKQNVEALKNIAAYSFSLSTKETVTNILGKLSSGEEKQSLESHQLVEVSQMLYNDCISALAMCLEGELKHFHRARYRLAQGLYRRGESGDLERAKEELSFCFKSSRSSFTINMWEIDSMVKKGRRKTPGLGSNKKSFEVNLPESSRKFITCIRKYILFYLKLLEETGDICTLDRAYISLRTDKRFSLCLEDLLPIALGMYVKALISCIHQSETTCSDPSSSSVVHLLEKMFTLFMEQVYIWPDISSLSEVKSPDLLESNLYGYLFQYIRSLEKELKLETLETINEKIRKRYKNPKLSNSNCAKVCRHASTAWCRSLIISLALITPLTSKSSTEAQVVHNPSDIVSGNAQNTPSLCIDLQTKELWNSSFEDPIDLKNHETKWGPLVSKIKNVVIKKASGENLEKANTLLRCSYNFYKESSWVMLPSVLNLYLVPPHLGNDSELNPSVDGAEILDLSIQRKLLLWAYMLLYGRYANISVVIKHCEENAKSRIKKVTASSSTPSSTSAAPATTSHIVVGSGKDESGPRECSEAVGSGEDETGPRGCSEVEGALSAAMKSSSLVPEGEVACAPNSISSNDSQKGAFDSSQLQHCSSIASKQSNMDLNNGENPSKD